MSGSISPLVSLFQSVSGGGDALLNTLYGGGQSRTTGQNPVQALAVAERNQAKDVKTTALQPEVQRATNAFAAGVKNAKSVKDLLANPAVMKVLLTANGMADQAGYTALATKVLTSNLNDPKSLANTLADTRWKTLAQTYNFAANGLRAIQQPAAIASVTNQYAQFTWRQSEDSVTPGLSNALTFKAKASAITSVDQILGDPTLRTVVSTALGLPQQIAFQSLDAQEKAISSRLDIARFKDPAFVDSFTQRYLIANSQN